MLVLKLMERLLVAHVIFFKKGCIMILLMALSLRLNSELVEDEGLVSGREEVAHYVYLYEALAQFHVLHKSK